MYELKYIQYNRNSSSFLRTLLKKNIHARAYIINALKQHTFIFSARIYHKRRSIKSRILNVRAGSDHSSHTED